MLAVLAPTSDQHIYSEKAQHFPVMSVQLVAVPGSQMVGTQEYE